MKSNLGTLLYAAILGTVCALLLTASAEFTRPRQEANEQAEEIRKVLSTLNVPVEEGASAMALLKVKEQSVTQRQLDGRDIYTYASPDAPDQVLAVGVQFSGPGLWGPIIGLVALEPDMQTIRGMTVVKQEETPGLGGEIATDEFCAQFVGKATKNASGRVGITINGTGGELADTQVNGITGATITCDKLQAIINEALTVIIEEDQQGGK